MKYPISGAALLYAVVSLIVLLSSSQLVDAQELQLGEAFLEGTASSNEGHLTIEWRQGSPPYRLIQGSNTTTGEPIVLYEGGDLSYFMTGLLAGESRFVVEDSAGASVELVVAVDYPNQALVFGSLGVGLFLLIALVAIVFTGNRRYV